VRERLAAMVEFRRYRTSWSPTRRRRPGATRSESAPNCRKPPPRAVLGIGLADAVPTPALSTSSAAQATLRTDGGVGLAVAW